MATDYLFNYLERIKAQGNVELAGSIKRTSESFSDKYLSHFSFLSHEVGLLFGNVQSGKTGQMFGIICQAANKGFSAFLLLTTDNTALQQQTLSRTKRDLPDFLVCDENDSGLFIKNQLQRPVIVVLKKNYRILRLWANVFNTTQFMKGNALFIVDDEADAASLNTLINNGKKSSINKYIDSIKNHGLCSIYLQVTGTPQAILLQDITSGFKPNFTHYFDPGQGYLGGDFFFPAQRKPNCITYIDGDKSPTRTVALRHIACSAQILASGGKVSNCLIHPSSRQNVHTKFATEVRDTLAWCKENLDSEFSLAMHREYENLHPTKSQLLDADAFLKSAKALVTSDQINILIMNGRHDVKAEQYDKGCNFIIGGNTLGRGVTFPSLQTIFYTRTAKKPQADTMWQHSRMFGYDRDPGLMDVFIPRILYKLFSDINATNNSIVSQIKEGINPKIYYPEGLAPTRKNVLDEKHVSTISGGTNYYPLDPDNDSIDNITNILERFDDTEKYYSVSLKVISEILDHIVPSTDFKMSSFKSVIQAMLADNPRTSGILVVRRNRDVAQWTGALLSPNDWKISNSFPSSVVLTMYQVTGTKGWHGKQLWVPNIKLPSGIVYYDEQ